MLVVQDKLIKKVPPKDLTWQVDAPFLQRERLPSDVILNFDRKHPQGLKNHNNASSSCWSDSDVQAQATAHKCLPSLLWTFQGPKMETSFI